MENPQKHISSDEIDLQELAIQIIRYFRKHLKFIMISTLVGILLSIIGYSVLPKVYESKMILMSDILTESYYKQVTESLIRLIKEQNIKALSRGLNLEEQEAGAISSIEIESVKKDKEKDKTEATIFSVTIRIKNKEIVPKLQDGIIQFLRKNEYVKIRVRQHKEMYQRLIEKIGIEISSLDSLKKRLYLGKPMFAKSSEMMFVDPTNIHSKIIELSKEQINYKNDLELVDSIQLVEGFTVFQKPAEPKLSILLIVGFLAGLFFSIGLLVITRLFKLANSQFS